MEAVEGLPVGVIPFLHVVREDGLDVLPSPLILEGLQVAGSLGGDAPTEGLGGHVPREAVLPQDLPGPLAPVVLAGLALEEEGPRSRPLSASFCNGGLMGGVFLPDVYMNAPSMTDHQDHGRGPTGILPLFAPGFFDFWQIIFPGDRRLVVYIPERGLRTCSRWGQ